MSALALLAFTFPTVAADPPVADGAIVIPATPAGEEVAPPAAAEPLFAAYGFPPDSWRHLTDEAKAAFVAAGPKLAAAGADSMKRAAVFKGLCDALPRDPLGFTAELMAAGLLEESEPLAAAELYIDYAERHPNAAKAASARLKAASAFRRAGKFEEALAELSDAEPVGAGRLATENAVFQAARVAEERAAAGDPDGAVDYFLAGTPPRGAAALWRQYLAEASVLSVAKLKRPADRYRLLSGTMAAAGGNADKFILSSTFDAAVAAGEPAEARALAEVIFTFYPNDSSAVNALEWLSGDAADRGDQDAADGFDRRIIAHPAGSIYRTEAARRLGLDAVPSQPTVLAPVADPNFAEPPADRGGEFSPE